MIPVIYYAHSMQLYNTEREQQEVRMLMQYFYNGVVYNPNRNFIQYSKNPMGECFDVVNDPTITHVAFSHDNKKISSGVYAEIKLAMNHHKPVYIIHKDRIIPYVGPITLTKVDRATNWAEVS